MYTLYADMRACMYSCVYVQGQRNNRRPENEAKQREIMSPALTYRAPSRSRVPGARVVGITPVSNWLLLLLIADHADRFESTGLLTPNHLEYIHCLLQMAELSILMQS
jgi:hypothetical protein